MKDSRAYDETPSGVLRQYVDGRLTTAELDGWLSEAEYDDSLSTSVRDLLASISLTVIEAAEGRAAKEIVLTTVALVLAALEPDEPVMLQRASASTSWSKPPPLTAGETSVVRGRISAGTGAS